VSYFVRNIVLQINFRLCCQL